jgi:threonine synthase
VPAALGDFLILRAVRESGGRAVAVSDEAIIAAQRRVALRDGMLLCPETAATFAALEHARRSGDVIPGERVVLFNCASALKYPLPPAPNQT